MHTEEDQKEGTQDRTAHACMKVVYQNLIILYQGEKSVCCNRLSCMPVEYQYPSVSEKSR